jgi:predicted permease
LFGEIRHALRSLRRAPGVSLTVVLTLALCLAATAAVGNLISGLSQRLPVPESHRLVQVYTGSVSAGPYGFTSYPDFLDYHRGNDCFEALSAEATFGASLDADGRTDWVWGAVVSGNLFETLRVRPALGRAFSPEEQTPGGPAAAVLSHRFWQERFGGDPAVVGRRVALNGREVHLVGVAPASFVGINAFHHPQMWVPIHHSGDLIPRGAARLEARQRPWLQVMGRLRPEVTLDQAQTQMEVLARQLEDAHPQEGNERLITLRTATHVPPGAREQYLPTARLLLAAVTLLLLIGCLNVTNLLSSRALARRREMATRQAVGASRGRLMLRMLVEALLLALPAGLLGLATTYWSGRALSAYFAPPVAGELGAGPLFRPDLRVFLFAALVILLVTVLIGVAPALRASRASLVGVLRDDTGAGRPGRWLGAGGALVVLQVALSVALLTCAGLIHRSMQNIVHGDPGYALDGVLLASIRIPPEGYPEPGSGVRFYERLLDQTRGLGGVRGASVAAVAPLSGYALGELITIPGVVEEAEEIDVNVVEPAYFQTLGLPLQEGELFTHRHDREADRVAVVNRSFVTRFWPGGGSPVGQRMLLGDTPYTILGVVADSKYLSLQEEPRALAYFSMHQRFSPNQVLLARVERGEQGYAQPLRDAVRALDPGAAVLWVTSLRRWLEGSIWEPRLRTDVLRALGIVGLVLTAVGVFSLMRYTVSRRLRELGIRLAIGAPRHRVLLRVLGQSMALGAAGLALGLPLAFYASRLVESFLYGVEGFDLGIALLLGALLFAVSIAAAYLPARRAARVDPIQIIRPQ